MNHNDVRPQNAPEGMPPLPPPGERVLVRCATFRCLAYRDHEGKWRDAKSGEELKEVLEVLDRL